MTVDFLIIGQGLAGTALAWQLLWRGASFCVLDREATVTSSRVAAGLVTPITGQRLAKSWRFDDFWPAAITFYARAEADTGVRFFHRKRSVRLLGDSDERLLFEGRRAAFADWVHDPDPPVNSDWFNAPHGAFEMPMSAHLATEQYLDASRDVFIRHGAYRASDVDPARDLEISTHGVSVPRCGLRVGRVIFCQGHDAVTNPWSRNVRFSGAKGEILTLRIPGMFEDRVVNRGIWLLPLGGDLFRAGSTFDHDTLDCVPTEQGREEICSRLQEFLKVPFVVLDHRAAVRPVIDAGRPSLGLHPECDRIGFFNGLGSKGALLAPYFARQLADALIEGREIDPEVRFARDEAATWKGSLTQQSHAAIRRVLRPGEVAIDATAGNGHDTRVLVEQVGLTGRVFAFEIQPEAHVRLAEQFATAGNVFVFRDHADLASAIPPEHRGHVGAAMFNLGYLPGSDRTVTTRAKTSVPAIRTALEWLRPGGILTVVAYTGHTGGAEEADAVTRLVQTLPAGYEVREGASVRGRHPSPRLFIVRKHS